jgi:aspartate-semialdehyde dehydrogenase
MVISTYQSVSGTGKNAMQELELQMKAYTDGRPSPPPSVYPHHIFNNCIPHIDKFMDNGNTFEEEKMIQETKKIMECSIPISVTCVRVPVLCSHGETVNITFKDSLTKQEICQALHNFSGVTVTDNPEELLYPLQHSLTGKNEVHVGRIRIDSSHPNSWNFWCVTDNIRKGAALNGIQIAEYWAENQI